jgi:protein-disulfide isomerase
MIKVASRFSAFAIATSLAACGGASQPAASTPAPAPTLAVAHGGSDPMPASGAPSSETDAAIPISASDPVLGSRLAPVTIVEFEDFQCPFCARAETTVSALAEEYGTEKLRIVWKNSPLPFHPNARPAAEAAMGVFALAGSVAFWKFHDVAFSNQKDLGEEKYEEWAKLLGVDPASLKRGIDSHAWSAKVDDDLALGKKIGVNGTPAFFINGVSVVGAQPHDKFASVIDDELQKANAKIEAGTPRDQIYALMTAENLKKGPPPDDDDDGPPAKDTATYKVPLGKSPVRGAANALVTIVEFADFQCPFCSRVDPTLKQIATTYAGNVRFVWKNEPLPFHPNAEPSAELALEARAEQGDKGFWDAHDRLFASQPNLESADLEKIAAAMKLDVGKVKSAIKTHKYKAEIESDSDLGEDLQANGTPHFFINGKRLVGAQPFDEFKKIIDVELASAQALVAKGTPQAGLYDAIIKDGKGAPPPEKKTVSPNAQAPMRGKSSAKVTIVEFADYQCPFCKRAEDDAVAAVKKNYGDKVKFVWRDLPLSFHQNAEPAAEAAREALAEKGEAGFWKMHDLLFANQTNLDRASLDGYAKQLGLDPTKFAAALDNHTHKADIDLDSKAASDAKISGTPSFVINGYFLSGAQPYSKFRKLIDRALSESAAAPPTTTP